MANANLVVLIGNLTDDPTDIKTFDSGATRLNFSIAVNRWKKGKDGAQGKQEVSFFNCIAWNRTAQNINEYLGKGSPIYLQGEIEQQRWETDGGKKRSRVVVNARLVQFLEKKPKPDQEDIDQEVEDQSGSGNHAEAKRQLDAGEESQDPGEAQPAPGVDTDDVPF